MLKNDLMHSHLKVRAACKRLICAVNDNPSAFNGLEFQPVNRHAVKSKSFHEIGLAGMMVVVLSKILGWH